MPMSRDEKIEKVQRLLTAHKKTKEALEAEPVTRELHPGTDIARKWTVITAAYSGLEQTIKYLLAEENNHSIAELIAFREGEKYVYRTHDGARLFSRLTEPTQDVVRDFYGRFQSLHTYITVETVDEFLNVVSGADGTGYERWRYTLIEEKELPRNSPEGLVAIWGVCVQIAEKRVWNKPLVMPEEALKSELLMKLNHLGRKVSRDRQDAGEPFQSIAHEIRGWAWRTGHPLNAFAGVLWHFSRYEEHGQDDVSEWLSDALTRWVRGVIASPATAGATSLRIFAERAQGNTPDGQGLRWDRNANRFEAVPWSMESRHQDALPPEAVVIGDPTEGGTPLRTLWQAVRRSGHHVLENRGFDGPANEDSWFCTLELRAEGESGGRPILTIWQKRSEDPSLFSMVEQWPREAMDEHLRRWIEVAQRIGEMRAR